MSMPESNKAAGAGIGAALAANEPARENFARLIADFRTHVDTVLKIAQKHGPGLQNIDFVRERVMETLTASATVDVMLNAGKLSLEQVKEIGETKTGRFGSYDYEQLEAFITKQDAQLAQLIKDAEQKCILSERESTALKESSRLIGELKVACKSQTQLASELADIYSRHVAGIKETITQLGVRVGKYTEDRNEKKAYQSVCKHLLTCRYVTPESNNLQGFMQAVREGLSSLDSLASSDPVKFMESYDEFMIWAEDKNWSQWGDFQKIGREFHEKRDKEAKLRDEQAGKELQKNLAADELRKIKQAGGTGGESVAAVIVDNEETVWNGESGVSARGQQLHPLMTTLLSNVTQREEWAVENCAEVDAMNKYLVAKFFRRAKKSDIPAGFHSQAMGWVQTAGESRITVKPTCRNCQQWLDAIGATYNN